MFLKDSEGLDINLDISDLKHLLKLSEEWIRAFCQMVKH